MMLQRESGRIVSVTAELLGDELAGDHLTGSTLLTLRDVGDFDELEGGTVRIADVLYAYSEVDNDADTLVITPGLVADASDGDQVEAWDDSLGDVATDYRAEVAVPGEVANDDTINASIRYSLIPHLALGERDEGKGESVVLELDDTEWVVIDIRSGSANTIEEHDWSAIGALAVESGDHPRFNNTGRTKRILRVRASTGVATGPAGDDLVVQVNRNGSPLFTSGVVIPDGDWTAVAEPDLINTWPDGKYLTVDITQVGSSSPGTDLTVTVVAQ